MWRVFTARYALSPYIKQIRFVFKGLIFQELVQFVVMDFIFKCVELCPSFTINLLTRMRDLKLYSLSLLVIKLDSVSEYYTIEV
jgi:hypothetical protein